MARIDRIVIGKKDVHNTGIYVSPPGRDVRTADDNELLMSADTPTPQLIMLATLTAPTVLLLGLDEVPWILLTSSLFNPKSSDGSKFQTAFYRPFPVYTPEANFVGTVTANKLTLQGGTAAGGFWPQRPSCHAAVFRKAFH